jgi:hypothetical protein
VTAIDSIVKKLGVAQHGLLRAADSVPSNHWKRTPSRGGWCAAEVVAHLMMVERSVTATADKLLHKQPKHFPLLKRLHLPFALVEARLVRQKTPIPVDLQLVREKESMLAELREVRERTLAFVDQTTGRDLSVYRWPHPFLGTFNMYEWFGFIASHELRHAKQIREIAASLPKAIASLQK